MKNPLQRLGRLIPGLAPYPSRAITLVCPVAAGGIVDTVAHLLAPHMSRSLGQPVAVENKPGAAGNVAAMHVAHSRADGYTLLMAYSMFLVGNPALFPNLKGDPLNDFAPVCKLAVSPQVLAVHPSVPAHSLDELVRLARSMPGSLNYATPGSGSVPHVGMELFKHRNSINVVHVPYKGSAPAMQDVAAGVVQVAFAAPPSLLPFVQMGKLRPLVIASKSRHPLLPDVPTTVEAGYPDLELEAWVALFAPSGTARRIVERLAAVAHDALQVDEVIEKSSTVGVTLQFRPPAELGALLKSEVEYWTQVIRDARITAQ